MIANANIRHKTISLQCTFKNLMSPIIKCRTTPRLLLLQFATLLLPCHAFGQEAVSEMISPLKSQDGSQKPAVIWQETRDLTWDDFTPVEGLESTSRNNIRMMLRRTPRELKIKNTTYAWEEHTIAVNPNKSLYNPQTATDGELRYFNVLFDIAELAVRLTNDGPFYDEDADRLFNRYVNACMDAFELESGYGKYTDVVTEYEKEVKEQLENNPRKEFSPEMLDTDFKNGFSEHIDYTNNTILGKGSDIFQPFNGFSMGMDGYFNKVKVDGTIDFLWSRTLVSGLFNDTQHDYDWVQGRKTEKFGASLKVGYRLYSNNSIALYPVAGIGFYDYRQNSKDPEKKEERLKSTIASAPCWTVGLDTDWTLSKKITPASIGFNVLRLKLYGTYEKNRIIGDVWLLNAGLAYVFGFKTKPGSIL